ncbi:hypothetical protein QFC20_006919 [Naganishia adeliensis]|uniref:Uncharacterized protein n=1 Tax=Naganishia adeliensis TaxID=92952 RepID=A0ACC2V662_9TREE|nr:hypothetical protein QFC20_006919 [Naganishia adeliensis]
MSDYTPPAFQSSYIPHPLSPSSRIHLITCSPPSSTNTTPILLIHGLGSSASFWLPALSTDVGRQLTADRQVYAIDAYGHGISDFVVQEDSLDRAAETVVGVIEGLVKESGKDKVVLVGHSMSGLVTSLVAARRPDLIEKLCKPASQAILTLTLTTSPPVLLSPTLSLPTPNRESLLTRSTTVLEPTGHLAISSTVSSTGISPLTHRSNPLCAPFIKHLILTTKPQAYAQACRNLASHPGWDADVSRIQCPVFILAGSEDYMVSTSEVEKRAAQVPKGKGSFEVMQGIGHWGGLEVPEKVAEALKRFVN